MTQAITLTIRVGLASIFLVSGMAKLFDLAPTRRTLEGFRVPRRLVKVGAVLLVLTELGLAIGLVVDQTARAFAGMALLLLGVFTAAISILLKHGARPSCGCFGRLKAGPIGPVTVFRNAVLMGLAGWVAAKGEQPHLVHTLSGIGSRELVIGLFVLLAMIGISLLPGTISIGKGRSKADGPDDSTGFGAGSQVVVFVDPDCPSCTLMLPEIAQWQTKLRHITIVAIGDPKSMRQRVDELGLTHVIFDPDHDLLRIFGVDLTPSAAIFADVPFAQLEMARGSEAVGLAISSLAAPTARG